MPFNAQKWVSSCQSSHLLKKVGFFSQEWVTAKWEIFLFTKASWVIRVNLSSAGKAQATGKEPVKCRSVANTIKNGALLSKIGPVALRGKTKKLSVMWLEYVENLDWPGAGYCGRCCRSSCLQQFLPSALHCSKKDDRIFVAQSKPGQKDDLTAGVILGNFRIPTPAVITSKILRKHKGISRFLHACLSPGAVVTWLNTGTNIGASPYTMYVYFSTYFSIT